MKHFLYRALSLPGFGEFFSPDEEGSAGGGGNTEGNGSGNTEKTDDKSGGDGNQDKDKSGGKSDDKNKKIEFTSEQQTEVDRIVAQRLERDRAAQKKKADEEAAKKAGEFEKLYTAEKQKSDELSSAAETANRLAERTNVLIDSGVKAWPKELKDTDPGKDNVEARLKWFDQFTPVAERLTKSSTAPDGEHGNRGTGGKNSDAVDAFMSKRYSGNLPGQSK